MSEESFDSKVKEIEDNIKLINAYDRIYKQMEKLDKIMEKRGE